MVALLLVRVRDEDGTILEDRELKRA
ncbi:protein of unknown function (plasmid) [Rhodovastum atsumiense]|nr:protein of unknown function [Rhodovastum atsumiense]